MREHVEQRGAPEHLRLHRLPSHPLSRLLLQLQHRGKSGSTHRLIAAGGESREAEQPVQRRRRHQRDDRGAVRIGDQCGSRGKQMRVDLRHHQRHGWVHAEGARVVHHHGARGDEAWRPLAARGGIGGQDRHINALLGTLLQFLHHHRSGSEWQRFAGASTACKRAKFLHRKCALMQSLQRLAADRARCTHHRHHARACGSRRRWMRHWCGPTR